ncbi:unnamed protein product [Euphydryas editha]|uniref:Uncharacterized protein n=1 Tax=Euphydryas editha TaxID=104508 RepID=A0AAU9V1C6_EUPED|nr:unnamed protein product [Euphydryas editha]
MGNCCSVVIVHVLAGIVVYTGKGLWLLARLGFTATGIVAGSPAAMAMACFGNVQSGSIISQATSMAMRS